jgi:hypothetical protein
VVARRKLNILPPRTAALELAPRNPASRLCLCGNGEAK